MLSRVEVSRSALIHSVRQYRRLIGNSQFYGVVKSNAYGHGLRLCVQALDEEVDGFAINHISEAGAAWDLTSRPFLVMGRFDAEEARQLLDKEASRLTVVLSDPDEIRSLAEVRPDLPFHLKIDTGMSRLGRRGQGLEEAFAFLADHPALPWTGIMTHFANVEDVTEQAFAERQLDLFHSAWQRAQGAARGRSLVRHAASSAAAALLPGARLDLVRVGISLYGLWPSQATKLSLLSLPGDGMEMRPALRWMTTIVHVNEVEQGARVGYGCTYQSNAPMRVAVLPVGYNEGYDRSLSNRAFAVVNGQRAPVLGRVCMNMTMVDVTHIPGVGPGTEAILIGRGASGGTGTTRGDRIQTPAEEMSADLMADLAGTINYEVVTRIHPDIPRILVD